MKNRPQTKGMDAYIDYENRCQAGEFVTMHEDYWNIHEDLDNDYYIDDLDVIEEYDPDE